jgi:hypothetical protein
MNNNINTIGIFLFILISISSCGNSDPCSECELLISENILIESEEVINFIDGETQNKYEFEIYNSKITLYYTIDSLLLNHYKALPRSLQVDINDDTSGDTIFNSNFYKMFFNEEHADWEFENILSSLRESEAANKFGLTQVITSLVQSIDYDKNANDVGVKYPYETFGLNKGDCDDKSLLLSKLLSLINLNVALFTYDKGEHATVGIKSSDQNIDLYLDKYVYIESTGYSLLGDESGYPGEKTNDHKIIEKPMVVYLNNYGCDMIGYNQINNFYDDISLKYGDDYLSYSIECKKKTIESLNLKVRNDSILRIVEIEKNILEQQNSKMDTYSKKGISINSKLDRNSAIMDSLNNEMNINNCSNINSSECEKLISDYNEFVNLFNDESANYELFVNNYNEFKQQYDSLVIVCNDITDRYNYSIDVYNNFIEDFNLTCNSNLND